ncbi:ABC transporter permease subunit [Alkalihalobacillus sp. AL-G]|uniref:ABC transporter permease subunit n=1 Tax=Alkalihalobacillus sp. AL-G TaxID=2926399 RepID=UPI0027296E51|nr:ABC transporter permease subunit [Alkalihalobacillus sp. AL-G]WLD93428.1 ABC transporter permease subunit [Alkalihalobacillus sp. AL-G]
MKFVAQQLFRFVFIVVGIILMAGLPRLMPTGGSFALNWTGYFEGLQQVFTGLLNLSDVKYNTGGTLRPLMPQMTDMVVYSLTVLMTAILVALFAAGFLTFITMLLPRKWIRRIKVITFVFESLPDLLIIIMCQVIIVWLYKNTGLLVFEVASMPGEPIYIMPIICLSILPMIQYFKVMVSIVENELEKQYVELAKAKGLVQRKILIVHVLRNSMASILNHTKTIIWFMLSNLLILEYIFNIDGIMRFLFEYLNPVIFAVSLLAIFIPIFLLLVLGQWLLERSTNEKVVM